MFLLYFWHSPYFSSVLDFVSHQFQKPSVIYLTCVVTFSWHLSAYFVWNIFSATLGLTYLNYFFLSYYFLLTSQTPQLVPRTSTMWPCISIVFSPIDYCLRDPNCISVMNEHHVPLYSCSIGLCPSDRKHHFSQNRQNLLKV